jgi:hypothetical protein
VTHAVEHLTTELASRSNGRTLREVNSPAAKVCFRSDGRAVMMPPTARTAELSLP